MDSRRLLVIECVLKNLLLTGTLFFIARNFHEVPKDPNPLILNAVGLLLAGSIAGTFAFSYEKTNINSMIDRLLGHLTTFLLNLSIGYMFLIMLTALGITSKRLENPIGQCATMVFASIIICDCWDVLRIAHRQPDQSICGTSS